jgi:hypothetical protein
MPIRKFSMHDTEHPPGQSSGGVKYLRDVIKKYYDEDQEDERPQTAVERRLRGEAPVLSTDAEKRLQRLQGAIQALARQAELRQGQFDGWWAKELRLILQESTKST